MMFTFIYYTTFNIYGLKIIKYYIIYFCRNTYTFSQILFRTTSITFFYTSGKLDNNEINNLYTYYTINTIFVCFTSLIFLK